MATVGSGVLGGGAGTGRQAAQTPFAGQEEPGPSPVEQQAQEISVASGVRERIANARSFAPSVRQQTQSEIINMTLLYQQLGNPFSIRRIPFSVLRDMTTDPMVAMGLFYIKTPLIRADWSVRCPDAQLAAAVDEAFRPIRPWQLRKGLGKLAWGYQPMAKRFRLGQLKGVYRDPHSDDPEKDRPIWVSENVKPIVWDVPYSLAPENCIPKWDESGQFAGFTYSTLPVPNPIQIGTAYLYGEQTVPGYNIPLEFAMWPINEIDEQFGSIYGSPRIKRAYRYYWSYWYRWALADRSFEKKADPPVKVYYPTDQPGGIDVNDPNPLSPKEVNVQGAAIALGEQARSGSVLAIPNDVKTDDQGKPSTMREWEIEYLEGGENFDQLDRSFAHLDLLKIRSLFLPESIFIGGRSQNTSGQSVAKNVSTPIEVFEESQQLLADEEDDEVNRMMIPQFIAANFPEKLGTPCEVVTRGFGQADTEIIKQLIQLVGQTKGYTLPVDTRELLRQANIPLLTQPQQEKLEERIAKEAETMQPPAMNPEKVGMQGYNSGVTKTPLGNVYIQPPGRIDLSQQEVNEYVTTLPDIPAYRDKTTRSMLLRTRKIFVDRYKGQVKSFIEHLKDHTPLQLAVAAQNRTLALTMTKAPPPPEGARTEQPEQNMPPGLLPAAASATAAAIVGAWFAAQPVDKTQVAFATVLDRIVARSGEAELKNVVLDPNIFDKTATNDWVQEYASTTLDSVDGTVQKEMVTFLTDQLQKTLDAKQIIAAAEEHFAETPETHASRVARAATRDGYNFGMLSAGKDAGIAQVQAHDASDGDDPNTDSKCIERDGKVFPIDAALAETEHPNGTLHWTFLSTDSFSIERVEKFPPHLQVPSEERAAYDDDTETLYVAAGATDEQERSYALTIGAQLVSVAGA